jgi:putative tryptophan/tyrosine transport system substrate-binding protein
MAPISDPIGNGLVASFARPGANVTGVTLYSNELAGKRLELLRQIAPKITRVAGLVQRDHPPTATFVIETEAAARTLGCQLHVLPVRAEPADIVKAFASMIKERDGGVIVQQTGSLNAHMRQMADLAMRHRLPTVHASQLFAETAGSWPMDPAYLLSATAPRPTWTRSSKGRSPPTCPSSNPLGLTIPPSVLGRADEIIQ